MTATDQVEAVLVHGEAGDAVQVSHHTVNHLEQKIFTILSKNIYHSLQKYLPSYLARRVVVEPDVSVLVTCDAQWQGRVREDSEDGTHWLTRHGVLVKNIW